MTSPSARFSAARVRSGASARAGISPEPQIGAPAQATMRRRGSAGSTMKPSASAAAVTVAAAADDRPITRSARPGAGRTPDAPACRAASTKRDQGGGVGMAERQADAERKVMDADQLGGGTLGRRRPIDETIGDDGLERFDAAALQYIAHARAGCHRGQLSQAAAARRPRRCLRGTAPSGDDASETWTAPSSRLRNAMSAARSRSTVTDTLADRPRRQRCAASAERISAASASSPDSGSVSTGMPSLASMRSAATSAANSGAVSGRRPRTWMLPREVTSTMPLPCARAAAQSAGEGVERDRADRRQPRQQAVAGLHRRGQAGTGAAAETLGRVHSAASGRTRARLWSMSFRRGCQRPSRRASSSRSAMARAAAGFSSIRKSRTFGSAR